MSRLLKSMMIFTAFAFAVTAADKCADDDQPQKGYDQGHAVKEHQMLGAYNAPARIDVRGSFDVSLSADFIWWQPKEKGLDLAYLADSDVSTSVSNGFVHPGNDYKPGFKIGLGVNFEHDNWGMFAEYTWLHFTQSKSYTRPDSTVTIHPMWNFGHGDTLTAVTGNWKVGYDMIDLVMQRAYYNGTKLTYTPSLGLRGGWIKSKMSSVYTGTYANNGKAKDKTWLVGPKAGFDANYIFGAGFRMFGKAAAALLYQNFKTSIDYYANTTLTNNIKCSHKGQLTPNAELGLGLGYGTYFSNRGFHFDIALSYDFECYWNQNNMRSLLDASQTAVYGYYKAGDLFMHGLTVALKFDF
jgi:hypothetical protein